MKIVCTKADLLKAVMIAMRAVPVRATIPVMECILIQAANGQITFTTNDMEMGIETIVPGTILEEGTIAIDARMFSDIVRKLPDFDVTPYLTRVAKALKKANMVIDVNTGTYYRYPIHEISPYPDFMEIAAKYDLPIITTSDAHKPEDCGNYNQMAVDYAKRFGYEGSIRFDKRKRTLVPFDLK